VRQPRLPEVNPLHAPKVFVSHASEDKKRFVVEFALKLRGHGIDVWLDKWEMLPGDSLVDKIFEEGIKNARAIVVVISKHSVEKPWVREELNAATVKKINGLSKLIPVVIDDCEVPECLRATVWEKIANLENYAENLDRIVLSIFGHSERPPLGTPPKFVQSALIIVSDLSPIDSAVLCALCDLCVEQGKGWIENTELLRISEVLQVGEEPFCDTLEILEARGYLELKRSASSIGMAKPTVFGFDEYLRATREDYQTLFQTIAFRIVNEKSCGGMALQKATQLPLAIVEHVVRSFELRGWMNVSKYLGPPGSFVVHSCSAELRRWLQE